MRPSWPPPTQPTRRLAGEVGSLLEELIVYCKSASVAVRRADEVARSLAAVVVFPEILFVCPSTFLKRID